MRLCDIQASISTIKGVGEATAKLFANLGVFSIADLLTFFPRSWENRTKIVSLSQFNQHKKIHTLAQVLDHQWFGYGRMKTLKIIITDTTATAELICFNRSFLENALPVGCLLSVTGSFVIKYGSLQSTAFDTKLVSQTGVLDPLLYVQNGQNYVIPGSGIFPLYPLTQGLSQAVVRKVVDRTLKEYAHGIIDELPSEVIERHQLLSKRQALLFIHQPKTEEDLEAARKTLIFEELFHFQLALAKRYFRHKGILPQESTLEKSLQTSLSHNQEMEISSFKKDAFESTLSPSQKLLFANLPFELTADQMTVIIEINEDINKSKVFEKTNNHVSYSMSRLLQGDVGSGKTLVAYFAALKVVDEGGQCAILAPTELLARQHAENAAKMLSCTGVNLAFLTGNVKTAGRIQLLKALKTGMIHIIIGTHALFSAAVLYKNLRLAIIDEQHRFGVVQRNALLEKGKISIEKKITFPHLLMMSATPIPQSLALTVFGDMDVSIIKTMPQGRLPIKTHLTQMGNEENVYARINAEIQAGHQAYFVYPIIEGGDSEDTQEASVDTVKSAQATFEHLQKNIFPHYRLALMHSKIDEKQQHDIMYDFNMNKIQIIVATSVVEVGVDVPNATCMVIEHAERFGLAALHQLRGRVGRSNLQSHCFLIYRKRLSESGKARLKVLYESTDGFYIAEQDLILRGPGEVLGLQQSGYLSMNIADPLRDHDIMLLARKEAFSVLQNKEIMQTKGSSTIM
ncbi:MAG: ATP-dependent DNA helicase RecG [Treponemataceae bacterium]